MITGLVVEVAGTKSVKWHDFILPSSEHENWDLQMTGRMLKSREIRWENFVRKKKKQKKKRNKTDLSSEKNIENRRKEHHSMENGKRFTRDKWF